MAIYESELGPETAPQPRVLDDVEKAAQNAANKLLDNYDNYMRHLRPDFDAYFVLGNDLHLKQRERLVAGLGLRQHPDRDELVVTADGVVLQMLFNLDEKLVPFDVKYRAVYRPPIAADPSSVEA